LCFSEALQLKKRADMPLNGEVRKIEMRNVFVALMLLLVPVVLFAIQEVGQESVRFEEGVHFNKLDPEQPGADGKRIQVQGFFMYLCGHCNDLEPHLDEWQKTKPEDVDFVKIPAVFERPPIILHAEVFYTLNLIGADQKIHEKIFHAIHKERKKLLTEADMDAFLEANGVNMDEYNKAKKSFTVLTNVRKASVLAENYGIQGVPALIVDGKYMIPGQNREIMIGALNQLIEEVRKTKVASEGQSGS
jgi:thiol:disulfide interchange protein DsbA